MLKALCLEAANVRRLRLYVEFPFLVCWRRLKEVVGWSQTAAEWTSPAQTPCSSSIMLPGAPAAVMHTLRRMDGVCYSQM